MHKHQYEEVSLKDQYQLDPITLDLHTYCGWLITKEEWLVSQHLRKNLKVILTKLHDFLRLVHTHSLSLHLLGPLQMLHMYVKNPFCVHITRINSI